MNTEPENGAAQLLRFYPHIFLAILIWREARSESDEAMLAVGCTVRERAQNVAAYDGTNWIDAMRKKWQYSSIAAPADPQLILWPAIDSPTFPRCCAVAWMVIEENAAHPAPGADSYFDKSLDGNPPSWAVPERHVRDIGAFRFYRVNS